MPKKTKEKKAEVSSVANNNNKVTATAIVETEATTALSVEVATKSYKDSAKTGNVVLTSNSVYKQKKYHRLL